MRTIIVFVLALAFALTGCRGDEGACTGTFEGKEAAWQIHSESSIVETDNPTLFLKYELGADEYYTIGIVLASKLKTPVESVLDEDDRDITVNGQSFVTNWADGHYDDEAAVDWTEEPIRVLLVNQFNDDGLAGRLLLSWPNRDEMACTFDLPRSR